MAGVVAAVAVGVGVAATAVGTAVAANQQKKQSKELEQIKAVLWTSLKSLKTQDKTL